MIFISNKHSCSKLHCLKGYNVIIFPYRIVVTTGGGAQMFVAHRLLRKYFPVTRWTELNSIIFSNWFFSFPHSNGHGLPKSEIATWMMVAVSNVKRSRFTVLVQSGASPLLVWYSGLKQALFWTTRIPLGSGGGIHTLPRGPTPILASLHPYLT